MLGRKISGRRRSPITCCLQTPAGLARFVCFPVVVCWIFSEVAVVAQPDCSPGRLKHCFSMLQDSATSGRLRFAVSERELDQLCRHLNEVMDCVDVYISQCFKPQQKEVYHRMITGSMDVSDRMCTDQQYRQEYIRHAQCINSASTDTDRCSSSYSQLMQESKNVDARGDSTHQLQRSCCSYSEYEQCTVRAVQETCGHETSLFIRAYMAPSLQGIRGHCNNYTYGSEWCSASSRITAASSALLLLVLVLPTTYFRMLS